MFQDDFENDKNDFMPDFSVILKLQNYFYHFMKSLILINFNSMKITFKVIQINIKLILRD